MFVVSERDDEQKEKGKDCPETHTNTALLLAAMEGHERCVSELISHGSDIWCGNSKGENLLMLASGKGLWKIVKHCLEKGSHNQINKLDVNNRNAVIHACVSMSVNCLSLLLNNPKCCKQINVLSHQGDVTPLMLAVCHRRIDIVRILLQKGADPNKVNSKGLTCLMIALGKVPSKNASETLKMSTHQQVHNEIVLLLLDAGADVTHVCRNMGETALTVAVANKAKVSLIEELLARGCNVNHSERNGKTALKIACNSSSMVRARQAKVISILLKNGASVAEDPLCDPSFKTERKTGNNWAKQLLARAGLESVKDELSGETEEGVVPKLYDLCRVPARQHVMNSFPNSNLFYTIPRLVLPQLIKDFLLYEEGAEVEFNNYEGKLFANRGFSKPLRQRFSKKLPITVCDGIINLQINESSCDF